MKLFKCDMCGREMKPSEVARVVFLIPMPRGRISAMDEMRALANGESAVPVEQDAIDLCAEDAAGLRVAIKQRQLQIQRYGFVEEQ